MGAAGKGFYLFAAFFLSNVAVSSSLINLPQCESCSGRADVRCKIRRMEYPCHHSEYQELWPGVPRDLAAKKMLIAEKKWIANFTWKPPYDSSFTTLNGFFLTITLIAHMQTTIHIGPLCFYANLTGTDWASLDEPHSVTFHFDCIIATVKTEVHFFLQSSPKPDHNAQYTDTVLEIGESASAEPKLSIRQNVTMEHGQSKVSVWFGPLEPNIRYHTICLSPWRSEQAYCLKKVNVTEPQQEYTFTNVPAGNYTIMIRRSTTPVFYTTAKFYVPEAPPVKPPPPPPSIGAIHIAIMILACVFAAVFITSTYYILRRQGKVKDCGVITRCICPNHYQQAAQILPNNNNGQFPDTKKQVVLIFYPESTAFVKAIEDFAAFVKRWGNCDVKANPSMCVDDTLLQEMVTECCTGQFIGIVLSEHINMVYEILNHGEILPLDSDLQTRFIFELLKKVHSEGKQKTIISFFPVQVENLLLKEEKILTLTEMERTRPNAQKVNLKHIYQMFQRIHDNQFSIGAFKESVAAGNEQMRELLESIDKLPKGLITGDKLDNSNVHTFPDIQLSSLSENISGSRYSDTGNNNMDQSHGSRKLSEKHLQTLEWAEEQKHLKNGHAQIKLPSFDHHCQQNGMSPSVLYQPMRNSRCEQTCTCDQSCDENEAVLDKGYSNLREAQSRNIYHVGKNPTRKSRYCSYKNSQNGVCHTGDILAVEKKNVTFVRDDAFPKDSSLLEDDGEFLPPDSESEDDSASMLCEKIVKINRRYEDSIRQQTSHL